MAVGFEIRELEPEHDWALVEGFYKDAPDYWVLAEGHAPDRQKALDFFTDGPPGCDPETSCRLGLFLNSRLSGLAELSFGFPNPGDAYLGFMMLGPWARNKGLGRHFLSHVETLARASDAQDLYLAVLEINPKGRKFWEREGFVFTGVSGTMPAGETTVAVHRLHKPI